MEREPNLEVFSALDRALQERSELASAVIEKNLGDSEKNFSSLIRNHAERVGSGGYGSKSWQWLSVTFFVLLENGG